MNMDYLSQETLYYVENNLIELEENPVKFKDAVDENDIKKDVLKSVIHSTLASKNQPDWALQLFKIYQKYPDEIIRSAVEDLKTSQTISCRKFEMKKNRIHWQIPFRLSKCYIYFQFTTFNVTTALEAYKTFLNIKENTINEVLDFSQNTIEAKKYGQLLAINEFSSFWSKMIFKLDLPQNTVILNPMIKDHTKLINELAVRLQLRMTKTLQENCIEAEQEPEIESENIRLSINEPSTSTQVTVIESESLETNDIQNNPLDMTVNEGNSDTIDRLKTWITDCMQTKERSPSPEFVNMENEEYADKITNKEVKHVSEKETENKKLHASKTLSQGIVPSLEEIKEGMLKVPSSNEERVIPYITELSDLLNKENFTELNTDETTLEELKNHFITQYAKLESIVTNELDQLKHHYLVKYLQDYTRIEKLWDKLRKTIVITDIQPLSEVIKGIEQEGGTQDDVFLTNRIIEFIRCKECYGATGQELKELFLEYEKNVSLTRILQILVETRVVLRAGICKLLFVHYKFQSSWLIETFELSSDEQKILQEKKEKEDVIKKQLDQKNLIMVTVTPWTKINGTLNDEVLKTWLCSILSHCLDYPNIPFLKLCEKFCYLKPVDVYYLLEVLQELGCIGLFLYENNTHQTLFSDWETPNKRHATFLDDFELMLAEPLNIPMTCLGHFFYDRDTL